MHRSETRGPRRGAPAPPRNPGSLLNIDNVPAPDDILMAGWGGFFAEGFVVRLTGVHFLLSYRCTHECDHCFLWSSPRTRAAGTMTLRQVREVLRQAKELGTVEMVYFEGGEPFLFYPVLIGGLRAAASIGFRIGLVSNCYWIFSTGSE